MTKEPNDYSDFEIKIIEVDPEPEEVPQPEPLAEKMPEPKPVKKPEKKERQRRIAKAEEEARHSQRADFRVKPEGNASEVKAEGALSPDTETVLPAVDVDRKSTYQENEYSDFIFTKYRGGKKRGLLSDSKNHNNTSYSSENHFVKEAPYRRKKKRPLWKTLLLILAWVLAGLATLAVIAVIVFFIMKNIGLSELTDNEVNMTAPVIEDAGVSVDNNKNTITYNGVTYAYNDNMTSVLCMGIDKRTGLGLEDGVVGTGGQADALYMLAVDTVTGETYVIAISRDIYSDIGIYSADGNYTGTEKAQLCLAYAYGDGMEKSCTNTVDAVSRLFYNLPINSYFAMDMFAICDLNDAVGGVGVELFDGYIGNLGQPGDRIRLYGEDALNYLQSRDVYQLESSVDRMDRQIHYLERFSVAAIRMTKKDITTPVTLFNIVKDNSVTDLTASKVSALGYTVATSDNEVAFRKVPGQVIHNGEYAEYVVDEQAMLELILDVYYVPVS